MKNIVKKITYGFMLTMLIASSFGAKANSVFGKTDEIVTKLVKSKNFESALVDSYSIILASTIHKESLSPEQIKAEDALMANYAQRLDLTFPEKLEMAQITGFATWEQYIERIDDLKKTRVMLFLEIPELSMLNKTDLTNVIESAVSQKDISAMFAAANPDLIKCLDNVKAKYDKCYDSIFYGWKYVFATTTLVICASVVKVLAGTLSAAIAATTDGAGTIAAVALYTTFVSFGVVECANLVKGVYGFTDDITSNMKKDCQFTFTSGNTDCVNRWKK